MNSKVAFITGASRGIGSETARLFASQGYSLFLVCHQKRQQLDELLMTLTHEYHVPCQGFCADLGCEKNVAEIFSEIQKQHGHLDVLINNAGISHIGLLQDMTLDQWDTMIRTDLTSVFLTCRSALPLMLHQKSGSIVNVSSVWGNVGASCEVAYSAAKSGLNGLTRALAKELAPSGIRVNAAAFGAIDTSMNQFLSPQEKQSLTEEIPLGRFGTPGEAAALLYDLAVNHPYLTGQVITMDGGWI